MWVLDLSNRAVSALRIVYLCIESVMEDDGRG
jgi:hypothetical protein